MTKAKSPTLAKKSAAKKTLADFRSVHDKNFVVPQKITAGLAKLGKDGWDYEPDFIRLCGVSVTDFSRFREQFADFYVNVGGSKSSKRVWAGTKETAAHMQEMV